MLIFVPVFQESYKKIYILQERLPFSEYIISRLLENETNLRNLAQNQQHFLTKP